LAIVDNDLSRRSEKITVLRNRGITTILVAVRLFGAVLIAAANDWDQQYNQHPNYQGMFTNREAWSATIVASGPDWFEVQRYGAIIRLRVREEKPRLFIGQRVRMVPFTIDDGAEIAELRLPDQNFRPVGVVRYIEQLVPKGKPTYYTTPRYDGSPYGQPGRIVFGFQVEKVKPGKYAPPGQYRQPPTFRNGQWDYRH
jgi:hypothetical protein